VYILDPPKESAARAAEAAARKRRGNRRRQALRHRRGRDPIDGLAKRGILGRSTRRKKETSPMQTELQITVRDMEHSVALDERIRDKVRKLEQVYPRIQSCRVVLEAPHRHKHQGKLFSVRLDVTVPGKEIVANHEQHEDMYVALRNAFNAARRQLDAHASIQRGDVKNHARETGAPAAPPAVASE
jgi:ribosomal subunit interface protein